VTDDLHARTSLENAVQKVKTPDTTREFHAECVNFTHEESQWVLELQFCLKICNSSNWPALCEQKIVGKMAGKFYEVLMNEYNPPNPPPITDGPIPPKLPVLPKPKPFSWWLRKLFACNPFYLVSAALLLFGCYRVSIDAPMFNLESARLLFNFTAIQIYEVLLVFTAIFLARRAIWYDSTLLVSLENLLVFVPFIFISQAALTDSTMALTMCLAGGAVAVARFGSLKRCFIQLNLPNTLLGVGSIFLALNIVLPLIYRQYGEHIVGGHINTGPAHAMNLRVWMLVLPAVLALANFLPRAKNPGMLLPQNRWLPVGLFSLWLTVTCLHLYSLGYIYQFDFSLEQTTPALWALAWTVYLQVNRYFLQVNPHLKSVLASLPVFVPLFAIAPESSNKTFCALTILNMAVYGGFYGRDRRLACHLLFASVVMLIAGLPETWRHVFAPGLNSTGAVASGFVIYLLYWTVLLRNPKLAILASIVLGFAVASVFGHLADAIHLAFQTGFAFFLLHSLRWNDAEHQGANWVRALAGLGWVMESFFWANPPETKFWMPCVSGFLVLGVYLAIQILRKEWNYPVVPAAAILVMLSGLSNAAANYAYAMPVGVLAVVGSFLLFGLGTAAALTRHLWYKNGHAPRPNPPRMSSAQS
jgi:hypothetical protein